MATSVTSKGQVTIPKKVRDHLRIKPGAKVEFEMAEDGAVYLAPATTKRKRKKTEEDTRLKEILRKIESVRGSATSGLTADEIMQMTRGED